VWLKKKQQEKRTLMEECYYHRQNATAYMTSNSVCSCEVTSDSVHKSTSKTHIRKVFETVVVVVSKRGKKEKKKKKQAMKNKKTGSKSTSFQADIAEPKTKM
jgi:hypothetical protein